MMKDTNEGCYVGCFYYTDSCFRKDCMIRKPAHKVVGDTNKAGQIKTLGDYIVKVEVSENPPKKITFDDWWKVQFIGADAEGGRYEQFKGCWKAAQENKE
jgi:hypothetical protein